MRKLSVWQEIRFSIYFAFIINGILIQWIVPMNYICNISDEKCFTCGLRTAVNLLLQGNFTDAYSSNKLIVGIVLFVIVVLFDVIWYACKKYQKN